MNTSNILYLQKSQISISVSTLEIQYLSSYSIIISLDDESWCFRRPLSFPLEPRTGKMFIYTQKVINLNRLTAMKFTENIHVPKRMNPFHFEHLAIALPSGQFVNFPNT